MTISSGGRLHKDEGSWTARKYREEQQERGLRVTSDTLWKEQ